MEITIMTTETLIRTAHKQKTLMVVDTPLTNSPYEEAMIVCDGRITTHLGIDNGSPIIPHCSGEKDKLGLCGHHNAIYKGGYIEQDNNLTNCNYVKQHINNLIVDDGITDTQPPQVFQAKTSRTDHCADSGAVLYTNRLIRYDYQNILVAIPIKESDNNMITLSQFYTLVKKSLNLRRFPKSKVKSTGLAIYPKEGNHRFWYFGVRHKADDKEKVDWIPYLSGEGVPQWTRREPEVKENDNNDDEGSQSTIGQQGEKVNSIHTLNIGTIEDVFAFTFPMPSVMNLPIKKVGEEIYLPIEYMGMVEALQKIIDHQKSINPNFSKYYAYITVDTLVSDHSLSILTSESEHTTVEKFHIYYGGDNYQVFVKSTESPYLTVTLTTDKLNTIGNGINPLFPENWTYQPCEVIE